MAAQERPHYVGGQVVPPHIRIYFPQRTNCPKRSRVVDQDIDSAKGATAVAVIFSTSTFLVTSVGRIATMPPSAFIKRSVSRSCSSCRALQKILAPRRASSIAMARPIPRPAPVMIYRFVFQVHLL